MFHGEGLDLRQLIRANREKGLARLALACQRGTGVHLSADQVREIIDLDEALHQRLYNEFHEMDEQRKAVP